MTAHHLGKSLTFVAFLLASCGGGGDSTPPATPGTTNISNAGGSVALVGAGVVTFAPLSFPTSTAVTVSKTSNAETLNDWNTTTQLFGQVFRGTYEVRVDVGNAAPALPVEVALDVPTELSPHTTAGEGLTLFAQVFQDGGDESLDGFEPFASTVIGTTIKAEIPPEAFSNRRTLDGTYEAILVVATQNQALVQAQTKLAAADSSMCAGSLLSSPLAQLSVSSAFNPPSHYGTDYAAPDDSSVLAMAVGTVQKVALDERPLPKADPRSHKMVKGYGQYVVVAHDDGSKSLYGHLQKDGVLVLEGSRVASGELMALSDNSGGSSGPHLHVEYAPRNSIFPKANKINPDTCIGTIRSVDPQGTWLFVDNSSGDSKRTPTTITLRAIGMNPGDRLRLTEIGSLFYQGAGGPTSSEMIAVFASSTGTFLPPGPGAPVNFVSTRPTFPNGLPTDIPEDFAIPTNGVEVIVPTGATAILFGTNSSFWSDNFDNGYRVRIEVLQRAP